MTDDRCPYHDDLVTKISAVDERTKAIEKSQERIEAGLFGVDGMGGIVGEWNKAKGKVALIGGAVGFVASLAVAWLKELFLGKAP